MTASDDILPILPKNSIHTTVRNLVNEFIDN